MQSVWPLREWENLRADIHRLMAQSELAHQFTLGQNACAILPTSTWRNMMANRKGQGLEE